MGKILFIRGGAVGDFILTMPAVRLVREQLPNNEIEILGYPAITCLATAAGLADCTCSIEDARLATFFVPGAELDQEWCDYFSSFDVVVSYLYDPDGYFRDNLNRSDVQTLLTGPFRAVEEQPFVPAALQLAAPLNALALYLERDDSTFSYPLSSKSAALPLRRCVALHPGSGSASKNWPLDLWAELLSRLHHQLDVDFLVTSGEAEHSTIEQFLALLDRKNLPFTHLQGLNLPELGAVFNHIDFYLGHDSGISHLAASAGAAGLLLFGPTNPEVWAPASSKMKKLVSKDRSLAGLEVLEVLDALAFWSSSHPNRRD
ncbi:MAG: hypothetical protein CMO61_06860 [Verrucomicrobiales bacterium]|jgi:ADP-heptose:LPS heptosyltransferase|nr:hypothetical protein [Verrucomicrobiales bacterium]|tara:strand:- start:7471 stop:8421 length:951 start_codon:yes stop_codon:yes gene_type:complete